MTFDQLVTAITRVLPECSFGEDLDGQIIVYTNKQLDESDALVELEEQS